MVLWMLLLTLIWGLAALSAKVITTGIAPAMAAGVRGGLALAALSAFVLWRPRLLRAPARPLLLAAATGLLLASDFLLYFLGAQFTTSGQLSVFVNTAPIFVAVGAHFILPNDRLHALKTAGLIVSVLGVVVLFSADLLTAGGTHWQGNLLVLGSSLSWGASTLLIKGLLSSRLSAFQLLYFRLLVSTPIVLLFSWAAESDPFHAVTPLIVLLMVFQALIVVVFSYMMWLWLLQRYPASVLQNFTVMSPVWAVVLGMLLLGEQVTLSMAAGMLLVGMGLLLVSRPPLRRTEVPPGAPAPKTAGGPSKGG
jgi:drug/metabolite transporter (DMT)-like permease